ncbi:metallophosphoesterase family protein [Bacillus cereus]|uniref:metallophosphoesterase family protein n=1 Tax=Bacillus cereus TaxID=1396 RepID=UPI000B4AFEAA|nr:metallophosphoesterase [Bacillus cereus]
MLIYVFSDFQGVKEIPDGNPDLVILLGDIYYRDAMEIDEKYPCPKIGVYGNHDFINEWKDTSIRIIHEEVFEFEGITFAGFGGCPRYNRKPNQYTEEQTQLFMNNLEKVDVFIAHSNPVYDKAIPDWDPHRGFKSFNKYIETKHPKYFLHGHIHEPFTRNVNGTQIYSVFPFVSLSI